MIRINDLEITDAGVEFQVQIDLGQGDPFFIDCEDYADARQFKDKWGDACTLQSRHTFYSDWTAHDE